MSHSPQDHHHSRSLTHSLDPRSIDASKCYVPHAYHHMECNCTSRPSYSYPAAASRLRPRGSLGFGRPRPLWRACVRACARASDDRRRTLSRRKCVVDGWTGTSSRLLVAPAAAAPRPTSSGAGLQAAQGDPAGGCCAGISRGTGGGASTGGRTDGRTSAARRGKEHVESPVT